MTGESGDSEYGLVMPFVVCASNGGPYEDQAFVAGYEMGLLDAELQRRAGQRGARVQRTIRAASVPQADMLAMRYGVTMSVVWSDYEWAVVAFR